MIISIIIVIHRSMTKISIINKYCFVSDGSSCKQSELCKDRVIS